MPPTALAALQRSISEWQKLLGPLLTEVAQRQLADFGHLSADTKDDGSLITACDRWSDARLVEALTERCPQAGILSEEGNNDLPPQPWAWVLDPLDGTTNFACGIPHWAISLALLHHGVPVLGWLEIPPLQQRVIAVRGEGATLNGSRLAAPRATLRPTSCASLCTRSMVVLQRLHQRPFPCKLRMFGVASLNLLGVALGQTLSALECTPKIWDIAAAWLILEELGCVLQPLLEAPFPARPGDALARRSYPLLAAANAELQLAFQPWANALVAPQG